MPDTDATQDLVVPPESAVLRAAYKKSSLTVADLAAATGLSIATLHIAMNGIRYRDGKAKVAAPPDHTLVKLASVLRIHPDVLRTYDRGRAADLLAEANEADGTAISTSDLDTQAAVVGRQALARQVLGVFSTEELRAEIERRDAAVRERLDQEALDEHAADLATARWPE